MKRLFGSSAPDDESEWLSVSDLMAGLMIVFLFIAVVYIRPLAEIRNKITEIAVSWQNAEVEIYEALEREFRDDLPRWDAEIDRVTLRVRFKSPDILFERGKSLIRPEFVEILADFFPRYVAVLKAFRDSLEEIRIEGHTSSIWNRDVPAEEAYFRNMALSQARTRAVLRNVLSLSAIDSDRAWVRPLLTANGLSSSQLILTSEGLEDRERSRRVEFRVRTRTRSEIVRILEEVQ